MHCIFSEKSKSDLREIGDFIAKDNPARSLTFVDELREHCRKLTQAPKRVVVDEIDGHSIRKAVHGR